jgi:hypothetical protein
MVKYDTETITHKVVTAIVCDVCKKEIDAYDLEVGEVVFIRHSCGYLSIFGDGSNLELDICQACFNTLLGKYVRYS